MLSLFKKPCAQCGQPSTLFSSQCRSCTQAAALARQEETQRRRQEAEAERQALQAAVLQAQQAANQAADDATRAALGAITLDDLEQKLNTAQQQGLPPEAGQQALNSGLSRAMEAAFADHLLSADEETALRGYIDRFAPHGIAKEQAVEKINQGHILREVCEGNVPDYITFDGPIPFNIQKTEKLIYVFPNVEYYERTTRTRRRGTSHGVNIRVAKGFYYSPRQFSSQTEEWQETVHRDTGQLGFTNKHIYFRGNETAFRRAYNKIVAIEPEYQGISYVPDLARAKPQIFKIGDTWFPYNLAVNLAQNGP